jgi:hypothetical protein
MSMTVPIRLIISYYTNPMATDRQAAARRTSGHVVLFDVRCEPNSAQVRGTWNRSGVAKGSPHVLDTRYLTIEVYGMTSAQRRKGPPIENVTYLHIRRWILPFICLHFLSFKILFIFSLTPLPPASPPRISLCHISFILTGYSASPPFSPAPVLTLPLPISGPISLVSVSILLPVPILDLARVLVEEKREREREREREVYVYVCLCLCLAICMYACIFIL